MKHAIKELNKSLKYHERTLEEFERKLVLCLEQIEQYQAMIPEQQIIVEELKKTIEMLEDREDTEEIPF